MTTTMTTTNVLEQNERYGELTPEELASVQGGRKAGSSGQEFLRITLQDVIVS
jgi:hypothetical protein